MTIKTQESTTASANELSALEGAIIDAIQDKKGYRITELDFTNLDTAPASAFIVCQGKSTSQVASIADNIREEVRKKLDIKPYSYDGYRNSQWIALDYGDVMAHIFLPDTREYYNLEDLWSDARVTEIPDLD